MPSKGSVGDTARAAETAGGETGLEPSQQGSRNSRYSSFPGYNTIQYETANGNETSQYTTFGNKVRTRVLGPDLLRGLLMMLMAMDHLAMALKSWEHGTGSRPEEDGGIVRKWNHHTAYIVRTLTHLCAPGFMMLLGMGVVYLGNSRKQQGWGTQRLVRYFALRMVVLTLIMIADSLIMTGGQAWFLNIVLFALAVDYFLAGMLWVLTDKTEAVLTGLLSRVLSDKDAACDRDGDSDIEQPLLLRAGQPQPSDVEQRARRLSWHLHNMLLAVSSILAIFWNIWLSENNGRCVTGKTQEAGLYTFAAAGSAAEETAPEHPWLTIWFWPIQAPGVISAFPPLAWLSFAIVGVLYGRLVITPTTKTTTTRNLVHHVGAGVAFAVVFVLTRLVHVGNLSEHCLQTPENEAHPQRNQYLVSLAAFFYVVKYPPDVAFWALTLAGNFFLLAALREIPIAFAKRWLAMLLDLGTAALFFYIVHMPVVFLVGAGLSALFGHDTGHELPGGPSLSKRGIDNVFGYFGIWALCMLIMWPLCRWYGRFKATKPSDSLWRFF